MVEENFSKIIKQKGLFIVDFLHCTYIKVDNNWTENVCVTVISVNHSYSYKLISKKERYYMYVNHSFIFLLQVNNIKDSDYNNLIKF